MPHPGPHPACLIHTLALHPSPIPCSIAHHSSPSHISSLQCPKELTPHPHPFYGPSQLSINTQVPCNAPKELQYLGRSESFPTQETQDRKMSGQGTLDSQIFRAGPENLCPFWNLVGVGQLWVARSCQGSRGDWAGQAPALGVIHSSRVLDTSQGFLSATRSEP